MSIDRGLVKNVHVVVVVVGNRLITIHILRGMAGLNNIDVEDILILCITFSTDLQSGHTLVRKQFPLVPAYTTTFISCQGLMLDCVGVNLDRPVFSHGQLYTALSRIRHHRHTIVLLCPGENSTTNVTYSELLV
jgi:hypothetical protein